MKPICILLMVVFMLSSVALATSPISGQDNLIPQHGHQTIVSGQDTLNHSSPPLFKKDPWWKWQRSVKDVFQKVWEWIW